MSRCFHARVFAALMVAALMLPLVRCGGGGGGDSGSPPPPGEPLNIVTSSVPNAINGQLYSFAFQASGGRPPYVWSLETTAPPLPSGLTLSPSGVLSGTPNVPANDIYFGVSLVVTDAATRRVSAGFSLRVAPTLTVATLAIPTLRVSNYTYLQLPANGGLDGYNWTLAAGSLPTGLDLQPGGFLQGTPQEYGTFNGTFQVRDLAPNPQSLAVPFSMVVLPAILRISAFVLPDCVATRSYSENLAAQGGIPPYTWSVSGLPATLTLNPATGNISGTPVTVATYNLSVQATDSANPPQVATGAVSLAVQPELSILTTSLERAITYQFYYPVIYLQGGRPPFTAQITSGALPPGMGLPPGISNRAFQFTNNPTAVGNYSFTMQVTDSSAPPSVASADYTLRVSERLAIQPGTLPDGIVGEPYQGMLTATGGVPPYTWNATVLPLGLTVAPTGEVSGTPTGGFNGSMWVTLADSDTPVQTTFGYPAIRIVPRLTILTSALPAVRSNQPLRVSLVAAGGLPPYTWSVSAGTLPAQLTLNPATGEITGPPISAVPATFTVQVVDAGPPQQIATQTYTLNVTDTMGRNDSIVTATPLSNGTYFASISPTADPEGATANADNDYYQLTAAGGSTVIVETFAERLSPYSPLDTVIEIVDGAGVRLNTCSASGYSSSEPCMNDDVYFGNTLDSRLYFYVPGNPTTTFTFYLRVLDWSGSARPDFLYSLKISGVK